MITRGQKEEMVKNLAEQLERKKIVIFTDFHGISVSKLQTLRRLLKKNDAEYKVAKKTLIDRALEAARIPLKTKEMRGEIGVVFGYGNEIPPAKTLLKFSKENETFQLIGGIFGARVLGQKEVITLAKLPSREIILSQLLGTLQAPLGKLVNALQGNIRNLVVVLQKIKNNKG